ncbi:MAG TPA: helicase-related protein, partial [Atopobiaceae bacterium]|nr:helicase-related protein [Atopobiaceae bacterium]
RIDVGAHEPKRHMVGGPHLAALRRALPFELTDEQEDAVSDILADMAAPHIMNRLLLGDVGTGKTAVCAVALAVVADSGTQAAVMAPTSVLARQYADKVGPLLDRADVSWTLITGSTPAQERAAASERIAAGKMSVVFGTTAILSEDIAFAELSFVVIDEQHRFGVNQRASLHQKSLGADLLTMTATPIPRTLALSLYGDVDVSRIKKRPVPGARVETAVLTPENLDIAYAAIRAAVEQGHQAYVICPTIDPNDDGAALDDVVEGAITQESLHAATITRDDLARYVFPDYTVGLLNGRMPAAEKDETMFRFHAGEIDVLVSTTVVEVGVDVPNATVMLVYNADRFGLATLHQLRGRVGRG